MEKKYPKKIARLHRRNRHNGRYDFAQLTKSCPELAPFVHLNPYKDESINFFDPEAVKMLNKALLKFHYGVEHWDIPPDYLCPPIPGRADYIHYLAEYVGSHNNGRTPRGTKIKCLDIGVGANCIYPIIGLKEYRWSFIGSDIDPLAIEAARKTVAANPALTGKIDLRLQTNPKHFFKGIIQADEKIDMTICNPPFHASMAEARSATTRKLSNLKGKKINITTRNFGGQNNEIWCEGGEERFVKDMILESKEFASNCAWFSSLLSKQASLKPTFEVLEEVEAKDVKAIAMGQGNKFSRIVVWRF